MFCLSKDRTAGAATLRAAEPLYCVIREGPVYQEHCVTKDDALPFDNRVGAQCMMQIGEN